MRASLLQLLIVVVCVILCVLHCSAVSHAADRAYISRHIFSGWRETQGSEPVPGNDSTTSFRLGVSISPFMFAFILDQLSPYGIGIHPGLLVLAGMIPLGTGGTLRIQAGAGLTNIGPRGRISDQSLSCQLIYLWRGIDARSGAFFSGVGYLGPYPQSDEIWHSRLLVKPAMPLTTFMDRLYITGGYSAVLWRWLEFDISIRVPISTPLVFRSDYPAPHSWKDKYFTTGFEFRIIPASF